MALVATNPTNESRAYSVGPQKIQQVNFSIISGDVSGTITCDRLNSIDFVQVHGVGLTSAPTFAGNVITLAFADPAASRFGMIVAYGK